METSSSKKIDIYQLRTMCDKAQNIDEIISLNRLIPELTYEEKAIAHANMDDGIYRDGVLIGEKTVDLETEE